MIEIQTSEEKLRFWIRTRNLNIEKNNTSNVIPRWTDAGVKVVKWTTCTLVCGSGKVDYFEYSSQTTLGVQTTTTIQNYKAIQNYNKAW